MQIVTTKAALREALAPLRLQSVGFVPTMGYLHEGHLSLMRKARANNQQVVASIFVNPTQFGANEDLSTYPRDPEGDAAACREAGVDILWLPSTSEVYAADHSTTVTVSGLTETLCGASRPTHFDGVTTIVAKLFHLVQPTRAYFGEKDFQQLAVIRRMVRDLDMPIEIVGMPIIREADGLAMSSRNAYLSAGERQAALVLQRAIQAALEKARAGQFSPGELRALMREIILAEPAARVDYLSIVDAETLQELADDAPIGERPARIALAVFVGKTRLIDNAAFP